MGAVPHRNSEAVAVCNPQLFVIMEGKSMDVKKYVTSLLENYNDSKKKISILTFELEHPVAISEEGLIQSLSISSPSGGGVSSGTISDKTSNTALNYRNVAEYLRQEVRREQEKQLNVLASEKERLDHFISLLDSRYANVIKLYYIDRLTWLEVQEQLQIAHATVMHYRDLGINELVNDYKYILGIV